MCKFVKLLELKFSSSSSVLAGAADMGIVEAKDSIALDSVVFSASPDVGVSFS